MSETTSAATGRCFGIQRVCQVWESSRSALYARRARVHHRRGTVPARRGRRRGNRTRSCWRRFGPILARSPFHGEGHRKVHARLRILDGIRVRPHAGAARHAGARTALPAPRASGRREDPRREGHHSGAQRDVGDGRRAGIHARRRVGLDLRGSRTLERGVRGVARVQSREPLRGTRSDCARARTSLWLAGRRRRPRAGASDGSGQSVPVRPLPQADPVLGGPPQLWLCRGTGNERCGRSGGIVRSRSKRSMAESFRTSRPSAPPWPTSWSGTTRPGVSRSLGITRRIEAREEYELR